MIWHHALGLGILQGVTEFLPVSSTAHLSLLEYYWGLSETPRFFDVMLHLGTLAAVFLFYRKSLLAFVQAVFTGADAAGRGQISGTDRVAGPTREADLLPYARKLAALLVLATLPAVTAAVIFRPVKKAAVENSSNVESINWRQTIGNWREYSSERPGLVAAFLACTGVILLLSSRCNEGAIGPVQFGWPHALALGVAQALSATCPGLSRSGMTISTALAIGIEPAMAVHFSLLMSIPAVVGAAVLKTRDLDTAWLTTQNALATIVGVVASAIVGWFCILLLMRTVQRRRWWCYGVYVLILAAVVGLAVLRG